MKRTNFKVLAEVYETIDTPEDSQTAPEEDVYTAAIKKLVTEQAIDKVRVVVGDEEVPIHEVWSSEGVLNISIQLPVNR